MAHMKRCPYGSHNHRLQKSFLKCERSNRVITWKKSPK